AAESADDTHRSRYHGHGTPARWPRMSRSVYPPKTPAPTVDRLPVWRRRIVRAAEERRRAPAMSLSSSGLTLISRDRIRVQEESSGRLPQICTLSEYHSVKGAAGSA